MRNWGMRRPRPESRRLVTSKETASLPTKEATNVDADGPQGALKAVRFEKGWTQATLARRLSIRPETVCRWERGKSRPRPTHVRALAYMAARPEAFRLRKEGDVTQVRVDAIRARGATRPPTPGSNKHRRLDAKMVGVLRALRPIRSQRRARAGWFN